MKKQDGILNILDLQTPLSKVPLFGDIFFEFNSVKHNFIERFFNTK